MMDKEILIKLLKRTADLIYMDENLWTKPTSKRLYYEITKTIDYDPDNLDNLK